MDDHLLPDGSAEAVGQVVDLVHDDVPEALEGRRPGIQHVAQDLRRHHDHGCLAVDGRVPGEQADAIGAVLRNARPLRALSLALVAAAPVVVRALLQAVATPIVQQALQPAGLIGFFAPKAPALLLHALAPIDAFGLWSLGLVVVAAWVTVSSALRERVVG